MSVRLRWQSLAYWSAGFVVLAGLAISTVRIQAVRDRAVEHSVLYLPSGVLVNEMSLGYREVVSDFVWLSAVQYYGDYRYGEHDLAYFHGLIDIITTLDPHFTFAYIFGALVVLTDIGAVDEGLDILKRGMERNPTSWELPFEIGFLCYVNRLGFDKAARYFDLASRMPDAPDRAKRFAAWVYGKSGDTQSSIQLWQEYMEFTDNPILKDMAKRYIEKLRAEAAEGRVN